MQSLTAWRAISDKRALALATFPASGANRSRSEWTPMKANPHSKMLANNRFRSGSSMSQRMASSSYPRASMFVSLRCAYATMSAIGHWTSCWSGRAAGLGSYEHPK